MRYRRGAAFIGALTLAAVMAFPAAAQEPTIEILADGLNAPRGVAIAGDGSIYVAEAGAAGDTCLDGEDGMCFGPTGAIIRTSDGSVERVIEELPSAGVGPEVGGVSDIVLIDDDSFYMIANLGGDPVMRDAFPPELAYSGWLLTGSIDGTYEPFADVAAFELTDDPDAEFAGGVPDSNPHSIAISDAGVAVADAGGNSLLLVDESGEVSLIAVLPPTEHEFPAEVLAALGPPPGEGEGPPPEGEALSEGEAAAPAEGEGPPSGMIPVPVQSVPTSVVVGPDGAYYVGLLTGGPFPVDGASVYRIVPGEEPTTFATGFTNIIDIGFGPDGTPYVAEIVHDGLMSVFAAGAPPIGAVLRVAPGGGEPQVLVSGEQMMALGGLVVGDDGAVYVTTGTLTPGGGAVVKITP